MLLDRETVYQLALAGGAVVLFIAGTVFVGTAYRTNGHISAQGGQMLVGVIGAFVLLMLAAGLFLERQDFSQDADA